MKIKKTLFIFFQIIISFFLVSTAYAQAEMIQDLANYLKNIVVGIGFIVMVLAGYYILTAEGDPQRLEKGRQAFLWGLIGVGLALIGGQLICALCNALGQSCWGC